MKFACNQASAVIVVSVVIIVVIVVIVVIAVIAVASSHQTCKGFLNSKNLLGTFPRLKYEPVSSHFHLPSPCLLSVTIFLLY